MNAMQQFKVQSCKSFPTHGEVLRVAIALGYRKMVPLSADDDPDSDEFGSVFDAVEVDPPVSIDASMGLADGPIP
jgi:hypothetical protein